MEADTTSRARSDYLSDRGPSGPSLRYLSSDEALTRCPGCTRTAESHGVQPGRARRRVGTSWHSCGRSVAGHCPTPRWQGDGCRRRARDGCVMWSWLSGNPRADDWAFAVPLEHLCACVARSAASSASGRGRPRRATARRDVAREHADGRGVLRRRIPLRSTGSVLTPLTSRRHLRTRGADQASFDQIRPLWIVDAGVIT